MVQETLLWLKTRSVCYKSGSGPVAITIPIGQVYSCIPFIKWIIFHQFDLKSFIKAWNWWFNPKLASYCKTCLNIRHQAQTIVVITLCKLRIIRIYVKSYDKVPLMIGKCNNCNTLKPSFCCDICNNQDRLYIDIAIHISKFRLIRYDSGLHGEFARATIIQGSIRYLWIWFILPYWLNFGYKVVTS